MLRAPEYSRCKANIQMHTAPHGIYGCQAGWESTILAAWKMAFTHCPFCQTGQLYGQVSWADRFLTVAWYLVHMKHSCCMIGQSSAHLWKLDGDPRFQRRPRRWACLEKV